MSPAEENGSFPAHAMLHGENAPSIRKERCDF